MSCWFCSFQLSMYITTRNARRSLSLQCELSSLTRLQTPCGEASSLLSSA